MSNQALALLVLLLPAAGAVVLAGRGWRVPRVFTVIIGPGVVWASFVGVLSLFSSNVQGDFTYWTWIKSGTFVVPFNLLIDHLSIFMCLVITGVGGLIITYAVGYMAAEDGPSYARFFTYMDVFIFSMLLLVLAGNFVFLIVGWAMVGLSSYLLIGFWYQRHSAVVAARKAFVMNVIGDVGMILGTFVLFVNFHAVTYSTVFDQLKSGTFCPPNSTLPCLRIVVNDSSMLELAAFLLLVGAVAKSAQLPLHTWLPDAMEGPTPVSALIHAATMVTAGVYLVARMHALYDWAPAAAATVAIIGAVTALFAATIGTAQVDIKRILAYSTMSQIGYMFLAVGIGAYTAGMFHFMTHAFLKALLFMAAGNVIHAFHEDQDIRHMGNVRSGLPITFWTFLIGTLSISGFPLMAGFVSKDEIIRAALTSTGGFVLLGVLALVTAGLTAFYMFRLFLTAFGWEWLGHDERHLHEAPSVQTVPIMILAAGAVFGGAIPVGSFLKPVFGESPAIGSATF